jgi:hypothetical protein
MTKYVLAVRALLLLDLQVDASATLFRRFVLPCVTDRKALKQTNDPYNRIANGSNA